jgi:hypothetical protein
MTAKLDPDLAGVFAMGYGPEDAADVFAQIADATGVTLVCLWRYFDDAGYGGDSQFYVLDEQPVGTVLYELDGDLWPWLLGDIPADQGPGEPPSWVGAKADIDLDALPVGDGGNYAYEQL